MGGYSLLTPAAPQVLPLKLLRTVGTILPAQRVRITPLGWVFVLLLSDFLLPLGTFPGSNSSNDIAVSMGTRLLQRGKMWKDTEAGKGGRT